MDKEDMIFKDKVPRKQELQYRLKLGTNVGLTSTGPIC